MTQPQNLFIPADAGEKVTLPGIEITIKVTSASTGNAFAVFEEVTSPGAGPALHVHRHQFEIFRFLEGTYEVKVGDEFFTAEPGAVAVVLPGHAHTFRNIGAIDRLRVRVVERELLDLVDGLVALEHRLRQGQEHHLLEPLLRSRAPQDAGHTLSFTDCAIPRCGTYFLPPVGNDRMGPTTGRSR